ncbi:hypothetical protein HAX39_24515 [Citrobacter freundii]|nr:hypothetical protein [Citrobacter freundii]
MHQKIYSKTWREQSAFIQQGRSKPGGGGQLTFASRGGQGLLWSVDWLGKMLLAWCDLQQWQRWVEPRIPHDGLEDSDPGLMAIAAYWSWHPVLDDLEQAQVHATVLPVPGCIVKDWHPLLTLQDGDRRLDFVLPDWPTEVLNAFTLDWQPLAEEAHRDPVSVRLPVMMGGVTLSMAELQQVQKGWVLVPDRVRADMCFISIDQYMVELSMKGHDSYSVVAIHEDAESIVAETLIPGVTRDRLPVRVMFDVASTEMCFADLQGMRVGQCLTASMKPGKTIRLVVSGCVIGHGELVRIEDQLAVRITDLY